MTAPKIPKNVLFLFVALLFPNAYIISVPATAKYAAPPNNTVKMIVAITATFNRFPSFYPSST